MFSPFFNGAAWESSAPNHWARLYSPKQKMLSKLNQLISKLKFNLQSLWAYLGWTLLELQHLILILLLPKKMFRLEKLCTHSYTACGFQLDKRIKSQIFPQQFIPLMIHIWINFTSEETNTVYSFGAPLIIHFHFVFHNAASKTDLCVNELLSWQHSSLNKPCLDLSAWIWDKDCKANLNIQQTCWDETDRTKRCYLFSSCFHCVI